MMNDIKKVKIFTIIIHSCIIIGAGHGVGVLAIMDFASIPSLMDDYGFSLNGNFNDSIMTIGLLSLIGKLVLILSLFFKTRHTKNLFEMFGLLLLWITVYFLLSYKPVFELTIWSSIPFLISSLILSLLIIKKNIKTHKFNKASM